MRIQLGLVVLGACSSLPAAVPSSLSNTYVEAKPGKPVDPPLFAIAGESMEFRVQLRGVVVGRVRTASGQPGDHEGHRAIILRSRAESDGVLAIVGKVAYELSSTIDLDAGKPLVNREETWTEIVGDDQHHEDDGSDFGIVHDFHSAIGRVRGWRAQAGEVYSFSIVIADANMSVELAKAGREYVPLAHVYAIRYDGMVDAEDGKFPVSAWISDDPSRVPVRFVTGTPWGRVDADLVGYDQLPSL